MTTIVWQKKKKMTRLVHFLFGLILSISTVLLFIYSEPVKVKIQSIFAIAYKSLIPSLFPFMIISAVSMHLLCESKESIAEKRENKNRVSYLLLLGSGMVFGFPIGAKVVCDLYNDNKLSVNEANWYFPLLNQTSFPFVVLVLGRDCLSSFAHGFLLYACMLLSAFIVFIFGKRKEENVLKIEKTCENRDFSLVVCIRNATQNMLYIVGFLVAFSIPIALMEVCFGGIFSVVVSMMLEISSGCYAIAEYFSSTSLFRIPLLCFCISFGGFCVGAQSKMCIGKAPFSMREYYIRKFLQGTIAFCLGFCFQFLHNPK